jgi:8-oxo-dGTP diphosphatase
LSERNFGVGEMIPHFLPTLLNKPSIIEHKCTLENNKLVGYEYKEIEIEIEEIK